MTCCAQDNGYILSKIRRNFPLYRARHLKAIRAEPSFPVSLAHRKSLGNEHEVLRAYLPQWTEKKTEKAGSLDHCRLTT